MNTKILPKIVLSQNEGFCFGDVFKEFQTQNAGENELDLNLTVDLYLENLERHGIIKRGTRDGLRGGERYWFPGLKSK